MPFSEKLAKNLSNRRWLTSKLRAEIVGPDPVSKAEVLEIGKEGQKLSWEDFRKPKKQINGEEIIWQDPPTKRYGAGILFPIGTVDEKEQVRVDDELEIIPEIDPGENQNVDEKLELRAERKAAKAAPAMDETEDYAVTLANAFRPSAIGLSFLADFSKESNGIIVEIVSVGRLGNDELHEIPSAIYRQSKVQVGDLGGLSFPRTIWLRTPLLDSNGSYPKVEIPTSMLLDATKPIAKKLDGMGHGFEVVILSRGGYSRMSNSQRLITVSLVNRKQAGDGGVDELSLFQSGIRVKGVSGTSWIMPYPETEISKLGVPDPMSDENINRLIYRQYQTFAIGHGCAADWKGQSTEIVSEVWSDVMPTFETPATSADLFIKEANGESRPLKVSMRKLAGLDAMDNGSSEIAMLLSAYKDWIAELKTNRIDVAKITDDMSQTAAGLIKRCEECLARIEDGINFLNENTPLANFARKAFTFANEAMLIAQLRATRDVREPTLGPDGKSIIWTPPISKPDPTIPDQSRGYWRAFQIAFLLMSLRGIVDPDNKHRETVDLIWFPTGGGKTEAYLGLTAFTIFFNRLSGRNPSGADVIMRYTLRLLTAQQFQRAALLFCSMENIRNLNPDLGEKPFRIGLWVGGSSSPNTREDAVLALQKLINDPDSENPFILLKCPWCGAKFGPTLAGGADRGNKQRWKNAQQKETGIPKVIGYKKFTKSNTSPSTVIFRCFDQACDFGTVSSMQTPRPPLPIVIIDEDLLEDPPSLVIGTVDKFAMLAWKPAARKIFGLGSDGKHDGLPPSLIIQDELHLISGPLGSMVGAYETIIERLCQINGYAGIKPKIIASTATISRAREQIRHLYAREGVFLFPPSGLEAGDSFFAREARYQDGSLKPGRLYVGVLGSAHGSFQTTLARVFASLMQHAAIMDTDDEGRDPWWTMLSFFNSLRELGGAASLFVADTRDYLRVILDRHGLKYDLIRKLFNVSELTSRIRSDQVPKELERLERSLRTIPDKNKNITNESDVVDACLASNIIEVGVDVSRLALMTVAGQPKTTSQYIQVSSRVGRDPEKPGLVAVLYGQSKPRDRSHFERFRPYHQRLYAQVEPTSVTPFSAPAVERALHGIIVSAVRQLGVMDTQSACPDPFPLNEGTALRDLIDEMVLERVSIVAPDERESVIKKLKKRLDEWKVWAPGSYGGFGATPLDPPLLHPAGGSEPSSWNGRSWPTMSSLRNVDASCEAEVTGFFNKLVEEQS